MDRQAIDVHHRVNSLFSRFGAVLAANVQNSLISALSKRPGARWYPARRLKVQGQKSNDQIMERVNNLRGADGFCREYGLCWKCIVAGAVAASPIDDDALVRAIPA